MRSSPLFALLVLACADPPAQVDRTPRSLSLPDPHRALVAGPMAGSGGQAGTVAVSEGGPDHVDHHRPEYYPDADLVAEVHVMKVTGRRGTMGRAKVDAIWSDLELAPGRILRDRTGVGADRTLTLSVLGGTVGQATMSVSEIPLFQSGERWLMFIDTTRMVLLGALPLDMRQGPGTLAVPIRPVDPEVRVRSVEPLASSADDILDAIQRQLDGGDEP